MQEGQRASPFSVLFSLLKQLNKLTNSHYVTWWSNFCRNGHKSWEEEAKGDPLYKLHWQHLRPFCECGITSISIIEFKLFPTNQNNARTQNEAGIWKNITLDSLFLFIVMGKHIFNIFKSFLQRTSLNANSYASFIFLFVLRNASNTRSRSNQSNCSL